LLIFESWLWPRLVRAVAHSEAARELRRRVLPRARGTVLEIGAGTGGSFSFFDPARVERIIALEPSAGMLRLARREAAAVSIPLEFLQLPAEQNPLPDDSVDTVVSVATLCTIPGVEQALAHVRRVLRPGGEYLFIEHGEAPDERVRHWQRRLAPIHKRVFAGCNVDRSIPKLITEAGFAIRELDAFYGHGPRYTSFVFLGVAV
jgi:ubiquinone/menaquinone biosynthesis C-methylase UbiE